MQNDKAFTIFAVALVAGVLSVITASVTAGIATMPTLFTFVEHLALSLTFRWAYKSFDMRPLLPFGTESAGSVMDAVSPSNPEGAVS